MPAGGEYKPPDGSSDGGVCGDDDVGIVDVKIIDEIMKTHYGAHGGK